MNFYPSLSMPRFGTSYRKLAAAHRVNNEDDKTALVQTFLNKDLFMVGKGDSQRDTRMEIKGHTVLEAFEQISDSTAGPASQWGVFTAHDLLDRLAGVPTSSDDARIGTITVALEDAKVLGFIDVHPETKPGRFREVNQYLLTRAGEAKVAELIRLAEAAEK